MKYVKLEERKKELTVIVDRINYMLSDKLAIISQNVRQIALKLTDEKW
jgi:hypothetical protein